MKFEQPSVPQESSEEQNEEKDTFLSALNKKITEMQESGRISSEQAKGKRKAASLIETGLSDDPEHDAEIFALSGIAEEKEIVETFEKNCSS